MPRRATKRGEERTPLSGKHDVLICGASFAGLAVARELAGSGADVLVIDRYEIGERQTSACGIPTGWLDALGLEGSARQEFDTLVFHTPHGTSRYQLPFSFSTFDYRELCRILWEQSDARFETATVESRGGDQVHGQVIHTDRGDLRAPLIVDALGWKRILAGNGYQPPDAPLSRGLEVHPEGSGEDLEIWIDRRYVPAGYGWSFPAGDEQRIGVGSFDPRFHVKETTVLLAEDLGRPPVRYQGNWIPHKLRGAAEDGIFFAGDSAGHCLPLTAEGIRTALYFGIACGRELREVIEGSKTKEAALSDYAEFNDSHERTFRWMLRVQKLVPRLPARMQRFMIAAIGRKRFIDWSFGYYLRIAPPEFAGPAPQPRSEAELTAAA
jgi:flavin-dependent dehydrogenase